MNLLNSYTASDCIELYFIGSIVFSSPCTAITTPYGIIIGKKDVATTTVAHELGHALGLDDCYVRMDDGITSLPGVEAPVDDTITEFVETIITNVIEYTSGERVGCYWEYARKLRQDPCTNGACASAISMFYNHRKVSGTGAATLDRLFSDKIAGYANSSNRLDTALSMLMVTNMRPQFVEYFVGVTNQLLSSGQPLPWINVGEGGN